MSRIVLSCGITFKKIKKAFDIQAEESYRENDVLLHESACACVNITHASANICAIFIGNVVVHVAPRLVSRKG